MAGALAPFSYLVGYNREPLLKGRLSTFDLLVLTSLDQLLLTLQTLHKTSYLNEEVNCTEPFLSVSAPGYRLDFLSLVSHFSQA